MFKIYVANGVLTVEHRHFLVNEAMQILDITLLMMCLGVESSWIIQEGSMLVMFA